MGALGQYAYGIMGGGLICTVILLLIPKGFSAPIMKLLCGLFFSLSILNPLSGIDLSFDIQQWVQPVLAEDYAREGQALYRNHLAQCIKRETEEYILDKAADLGVSVSAEVILTESEIPVPEGAILSGTMEEEAKLRLQQIIRNDLNISKENLLWTEENSVKGE